MNQPQNRSTRQQQKRQIKELIKRAAKPPNKLEDCISLGDQLLQVREWDSASNCFKHALTKDPGHFQALMKLAYAQACSGQLKLAILSYNKCLQIEPENIDLLNNLAAMCLAFNQPEVSSIHARSALKLNNQNPNSHYLLAESLRLLNQDQSTTHYEQALVYYQNHNRDLHTLIKISRALRFTNRLPAALEHLQKIVSVNPHIPGAYYELGQTLEQLNQAEQAKRAYRRTLELAPHHAEALANYAELMARDGKLSKSTWAYRRLNKLFPDNSSFKHLLKASKQDTSSDIDENYIKDVFDDYSEAFEDHLVKTLGYQTPQQLHKLFISQWDNNPLSIMDLGCGTGLCGPLFRSIAKDLTGVDLSQGMLNEARKKNVYDDLILSELVASLSQAFERYDLLIAADVLIYVGALDKLFNAAHHALTQKGALLFSVESTKGQTFKLDASGRYKHSDIYIERLCEEFNFNIVKAEDCIVRMESKEAVSGKNYLISKA